jgi:hypothetical protein
MEEDFNIVSWWGCTPFFEFVEPERHYFQAFYFFKGSVLYANQKSCRHRPSEGQPKNPQHRRSRYAFRCCLYPHVH